MTTQLQERIREDVAAWEPPELGIGNIVEVWPNAQISGEGNFGMIIGVMGHCADIQIIYPNQGIGYRYNCFYYEDPDVELKPDMFIAPPGEVNKCGVFRFSKSELLQRQLAAQLPAINKTLEDLLVRVKVLEQDESRNVSQPVQVKRRPGRPPKVRDGEPATE